MKAKRSGFKESENKIPTIFTPILRHQREDTSEAYGPFIQPSIYNKKAANELNRFIIPHLEAPDILKRIMSHSFKVLERHYQSCFTNNDLENNSHNTWAVSHSSHKGNTALGICIARQPLFTPSITISREDHIKAQSLCPLIKAFDKVNHSLILVTSKVLNDWITNSCLQL